MNRRLVDWGGAKSGHDSLSKRRRENFRSNLARLVPTSCHYKPLSSRPSRNPPPSRLANSVYLLEIMSLLGKKWPAPVGEFFFLFLSPCANGGRETGVANGSCRITGKTMFPFYAAGMLSLLQLAIVFAIALAFYKQKIISN